MKTARIFLFCWLLIGTFTVAASAPPLNDNFADRIGISLDSFPPDSRVSYGATVGGSNENATKEPGEPDHAEGAGGKSVWWTFTVPANSSVRVLLSTTLAPLLAVYTGEEVTNLAPIAATSFVNADEGSYAIVEFTATAGSVFQVAVDGQGGESGDISLTIELYPPLAPFLGWQPGHQFALPGKTVYLKTQAGGTPPLIYQWKLNGTPIAGATNDSYEFVVASANDFGTYTVTVTNLGGSITSKPALLEPATGSLVSVFNDSRYVSTAVSATGGAFLEQESLWSLNHPVAPFLDISQAVTNGILLFPAQENGALAPDLSQTEQGALSNFVAGGGILIVHGSYFLTSGHAADLLNKVFGWSLQERPAITTSTLDLTCTNTVFVSGSVWLDYNFASSILAAGTLPASGLPIYSGTGGSSVALLPQGAGRVVFLGWDWINAAPYSGNDGGWLDVLDRATRAKDPPSPPLPPKIVNPKFLETGEFQFGFQGYFLKAYSVLVSTNLVDWEEESIPTEPIPGQFLYRDPLPMQYPARYYRVHQLE